MRAIHTLGLTPASALAPAAQLVYTISEDDSSARLGGRWLVAYALLAEMVRTQRSDVAGMLAS